MQRSQEENRMCTVRQQELWRPAGR